MDETKVGSLIAEGENERIDFKRELDLKSEGKAEFVKDVISLANSAPDGGYLLIGVDKDKYIVGIENLEEEQIQQIAHTYINPAVVLQCSLVPIATSGFPSVGVIEIKATTRPHKVTRAIDRLNQDDVFVRHGSVVTKASPEEIIRMDEESRLHRGIRQYIRSAETHLRLGNLQSAISAYSEAIDLMPTSDLLIARGRVYERQMDVLDGERTETAIQSEKELANLAFKDFSDAITLADSINLETEARFGRLRVYSKSLNTAQDVFEQDVEWLKANTEGREYGEVLFWEVNAYDGVGYCAESPDEACASLDKAIQLGYTEPDAFYLRAYSSFYACNYGLALRDIDEAINRTEPEDKNLVKFLHRRAEILFAMNRLRNEGLGLTFNVI